MLSRLSPTQGDPSLYFSTGRDIANEAFCDALAFLETEYAGDAESLAWLNKAKSTSMADLVAVTEKVEAKYRQSSKANKGFGKWLHGLSLRITHYGEVLDTLAQHHPEYLALAWGMVKFVLLGVINHGKLVAEFAQALSMVAEALPRVELSAKLYQTDQMKDTVARLYAHIILFLKRATKWYSASRTGRAIAGLFKPYELTYKDTIDQISQSARSIDDLAGISSKAEIRGMSLTLSEHGSRLVGIGDRLKTIEQYLISSSTKVDEIHVDMKLIKPRIFDMHYKDMLDVLKPSRLPEHALQKHKSILARASPAHTHNQGVTQILQTVGQWVSSPNASLLVLQTQPRARIRVKQIATEVIGLLKPQAKNVIWYLSDTSVDDTACTGEVLRNLVFQLVTLAPDFVSGNPDSFNVAKLSASHSEAEWFDLLCQILGQLPACYIIVEAEDVWNNEDQSTGLMEVLTRLSQHLDDNKLGTKLLVVSYDRSWEVGGNSARVVEIVEESHVPKPRGPRRIGRGARGRMSRC